MSAREATEERILKFLRERGETGASAAEIAAQFLQARGGERVAEAVVEATLGTDRRFCKGGDGRWRAAATVSVEEAPRPVSPSKFTIVEFTMLHVGNARVPVEAAAIHLPASGASSKWHTAIRLPRDLPPGTRLPEDLAEAAQPNAPHLANVLERLAQLARGTILVSMAKTPFHARVCRSERGGQECEHIALTTLAQRLGLVTGKASPHDLAESVGVVCPEEPRAMDLVRVDAEILAALREEAEARGAREATALLALQRPPVHETDFSRHAFDWGYLQTLPEAPGVYIMMDASGTTIYVGKAANLRERVSSYFRSRVHVDEKTEKIREQTYKLSIQVVGSELEALLLEHECIQELSPAINRQYEVHERRPSCERPANLILILPSAAEGCAELFMVSGGAYLTQLRVARDDPDEAREAVLETYFSERPARDESDRRPQALELLWSWLEQHKDEVNSINVDACGGPDETLRLLAEYLRDDPRARRRTFRI